MRLLICAGGTGGGVYPALSVLQALSPENSALQVRPEDLAVLWIGSEEGMEGELVKRVGMPFKAIPAAGVHGVGLRALPGNLGRLARGFRAARRILEDFHPDVLFFTGGYVAVPLMLAARLPLHGLPRPRSLVYIPDIEPGWALRVLVRFSDQVALTTEESRAFLPRGKQATVTGYPVRRSLKPVDRAQARGELGLTENLPVFLVLGGSKGARTINRALLNALPQLLAKMQVVHVTGQVGWAEVEAARQALPPNLAARYQAFPYLHEEIGVAFSAADLVLSRAGASCLGEFPLFGLPAVLVPYPYAWRYQRVNAEYLIQRGAAVVVPDGDLASRIVPVVQSLMTDALRRQSMQQAMSALVCTQASERIAGILQEMSSPSR